MVINKSPYYILLVDFICSEYMTSAVRHILICAVSLVSSLLALKVKPCLKLVQWYLFKKIAFCFVETNLFKHAEAVPQGFSVKKVKFCKIHRKTPVVCKLGASGHFFPWGVFGLGSIKTFSPQKQFKKNSQRFWTITSLCV